MGIKAFKRKAVYKQLRLISDVILFITIIPVRK